MLLTDLVMPGVDGIEAIRRLRPPGSSTGILVLTSFGAEDQVIPAIRAGADGYLLKDVDPLSWPGRSAPSSRGEPMLAPPRRRRCHGGGFDDRRSTPTSRGSPPASARYSPVWDGV